MGPTRTGAMRADTPNDEDRAWPRDAFTWLGLGVATFSLSEVSLLAPFAEQGTALFWLASGLALGVLINLPFESWAGAVAATFLFYLASNLNHSIPLGLSITFSLANALEAACGAALFSFVSDRIPRSRVAKLGLLIGAGAVACTICAMISVGALVLSDQVSDIGRSLSLWFVADFLGIVLMAPFVIAWWPGSSWHAETSPSRFKGELVLAVTAALVLAFATFWRNPTGTWFTLLLYSELVLLVVCSLRLGARGTSTVALFIAAVAVSGTLAGHGPFVVGTSDIAEQATHLQIYLATISLAGLIPGLLVADHLQTVGIQRERAAQENPREHAQKNKSEPSEISQGKPYPKDEAREMLSTERERDSKTESLSQANRPRKEPTISPSKPSVEPFDFCTVGDIAAGAAHDFNNFLTAIHGSAFILSFDAREEQKELLKDILDASEAARRFTALLTALKCEEQVRFEEVESSQLLKEARRTLSRLAGPRVTSNVIVPGGEQTIHTDPRQLQFLLFQFAFRARQTLTNGGTLSIHAGSEDAASSTLDLELTCVANEPKDQRAFRECLDEMASAHESRKNESIFTSASAQTRLGAKLVIVDQPSKTTVKVTLNKKERPQDARPPGQSLPPSLKGSRILVVEDGAELKAPLERLLLRMGLCPKMVGDSEAALQAVNDEKFDLVLTDLMMPGMNGQELRDAIYRAAPTLPVILMSGFGKEALSPRLQGSQGGTLLRKPFTAQELSGALVEALNAPKKEPEELSPRS